MRARLAKRACNLPNAHLGKCRGLTNWSNALRIWSNAQFGQMRVTVPLATLFSRERCSAASAHDSW